VAPSVVLRLRLRPALEIQVGSTEDARALLYAIDLDVSQKVATFRTPSLALAKDRYGMVAGGGVGLLWVMMEVARVEWAMAGAFVLGLLVMSTLFVVPARVGVGADGIALGWLWTRRFVGYDEITGVTRFDKDLPLRNLRMVGLSLELRSGERVLVPVSHRGDPSSIDILEERIREARETFRQGGTVVDAARLRRGVRDVGAWVTALRSLGTRANADLRTAPVAHESLFRIVEDPAAPAVDRAAAAVALGSDLDDESRARLRSAAEATAAPRLRIAIEKAARGEGEAELEAALAEIEQEGKGLREKAS
jgi:hypothetical protein